MFWGFVKGFKPILGPEKQFGGGAGCEYWDEGEIKLQSPFWLSLSHNDAISGEKIDFEAKLYIFDMS